MKRAATSFNTKTSYLASSTLVQGRSEGSEVYSSYVSVHIKTVFTQETKHVWHIMEL